MIRIYSYAKCSTCRSALKFLADQKLAATATVVPIREQPPTKTELRRMLQLADGNLRRLFNTSGEDYRRLNLKERLPEMSEEEAIDLLSKNGNLVKRPFLLTESGGAVGFVPSEWEQLLR